MTPAFTVIHNPFITAGPTASSPRPLEDGDAIGLLTGRQFHVVGTLVLDVLDYVDPAVGGVFVTGSQAEKRVARLRQEHPLMPMVIEPAAVQDYWATAEEPFRIDIGENELFPRSLDVALSLQRMGGSNLAMTPTGQIRTGDSAALKAAVREANSLDRTDMLLTLPLEAGWLSNEQYVTQIIRVIDRSTHPVALTFTDRTNPLGSQRRLRAYHRIFKETTGTVIAYRTDLAGLDARAHGALACAVGTLPSARRLNPVGQHGFAVNREDLSPHMLIGDMLRYVRSTHMRRTWFAEAPALRCFCAICRGNDIDRLHGSEPERVLGHLHNVLELGRLHASTLDLSPDEIARTWQTQVAGARDTYPQLESHIGASVKIPDDLNVWVKTA